MLWPLWALPSIVLLFMFCTWVSLQSSKAGFARSKRLQLSCAVHQNSLWKGSCKCAVLGDVTLLVQEGRHHCDTVIFLVGQGTKHTHGTRQTGMNLCPNTELSFQSWLTITHIKKEQLIPQNWYSSIFFSFNLYTAEPNYFMSSKTPLPKPCWLFPFISIFSVCLMNFWKRRVNNCIVDKNTT